MTAMWMDYGPDWPPAPEDCCPICGAETCSLRHLRERLQPLAVQGARAVLLAVAVIGAFAALSLIG